MGMGTDTTNDPAGLLAVALGLSEDQLLELRELAGMHDTDPVTLVRDMVLGQLDLARTCAPDGVEVTFRDFREGSDYLSNLGRP